MYDKKNVGYYRTCMVASLSIAGCTASTNNTNQTPSAASSAAPTGVTQHDAFLGQYFTAYENMESSNSNVSNLTWQLDWITSTSAHLQQTFFDKSTNLTNNVDETFMVFPTTQDATNYVNAMNLTAYIPTSTPYIDALYQNVTGHAPQISKAYMDSTLGSNISDYRAHEIFQFDNTVEVATARYL